MAWEWQLVLAYISKVTFCYASRYLKSLRLFILTITWDYLALVLDNTYVPCCMYPVCLIIVEKPVCASAHPPSLPLSTASSISLMKMKIMKVFANFPNHCNLSVTRTRAESGRGQGCMASFLLISQLHQIHSPPPHTLHSDTGFHK